MLTIPAHKLKAAVTHAAVRDVRYYLCGVLLEAAQNGDLHIVATDGRRMFIGVLPGAADGMPELTHIIVPIDVIKRQAKKATLNSPTRPAFGASGTKYSNRSRAYFRPGAV